MPLKAGPGPGERPASASRLAVVAGRLLRWPRRRGSVSLALQGGGAHGAFTWGVLDALLADGSLHVEGISGSSAGAINAVLVAEGWRKGGPAGARAALDTFWTALGRQLPFEWLTEGKGESIGLTTATRLMMKWAGRFSPEQLNPLDLSTLRDLLLQQIDFDALRADSPVKLYLGATQVNTGKLRIFREAEVSVDVLLASSCLPKLHKTVVLDGEPYWDGGYAANPPVFPLVFDGRSADVMLVLLAPMRHAAAPRGVEEIAARAAELSFTTHFLREMHLFARARAHGGWSLPGSLERRMRRVRLHVIDTQGLASMARTETRLIAHTPFLELMRDQGIERTRAWLATHHGAIGQRNTLDLDPWFA